MRLFSFFFYNPETRTIECENISYFFSKSRIEKQMLHLYGRNFFVNAGNFINLCAFELKLGFKKINYINSFPGFYRFNIFTWAIISINLIYGKLFTKTMLTTAQKLQNSADTCFVCYLFQRWRDTVECTHLGAYLGVRAWLM